MNEDLPPHLRVDFIQRVFLNDKTRPFIPEDILARLTPVERLSGLNPEDRLRGLEPEERLRGLGPEELKRLKDYLNKMN